MHSPDALDPGRLEDRERVFASHEFYRASEDFFCLLPESLRSRVTVLARPSGLSPAEEEIKCACFCPGLKSLPPREEAQILDRLHTPESLPDSAGNSPATAQACLSPSAVRLSVRGPNKPQGVAFSAATPFRLLPSGNHLFSGFAAGVS